MSENKNSGMMQVCGLWKNKDKEGRTFLSGNLNSSVGILIFLNGYKSEDKQPDYRMYFVQREQDAKKAPDAGGDDLDQDAGGGQAADNRGSTNPPPPDTRTPEQKAAAQKAEDNIPF